MQIDAQEYLDLVEETGRLVTFDIEATGLKGDYNSVLVVSIKPFGKKVNTIVVERPGNDRELLILAKEELEKASAWITYYGKGFDIKMLNTRLLSYGLKPVTKRPHIDMYFQLKEKLLLAHKSQAHILGWLGTDEQKMSVSAKVWSEVVADPAKHLPKLKARCESDVRGLEALYSQARHLIIDITR